MSNQLQARGPPTHETLNVHSFCGSYVYTDQHRRASWQVHALVSTLAWAKMDGQMVSGTCSHYLTRHCTAGDVVSCKLIRVITRLA